MSESEPSSLAKCPHWTNPRLRTSFMVGPLWND